MNPPHKPRRSVSSSSSWSSSSASSILPRQSPGPNEIFRDVYMAVFIDESTKIIWNVRSAEPFPSLVAADGNMDTLIGLLEKVDRPRYALLTDLRAAPGRNDPAFEATMERSLGRLTKGFRRLGTLVKTAAGVLQIKRIIARYGAETMVTSDEAQLVKYLTTSPR